MWDSIPDALLRQTLAAQGVGDQVPPPSLWFVHYFYVVVLSEDAQPDLTQFVASLGGWGFLHSGWINTVDGIPRRVYEFTR